MNKPNREVRRRKNYTKAEVLFLAPYINSLTPKEQIEWLIKIDKHWVKNYKTKVVNPGNGKKEADEA